MHSSQIQFGIYGTSTWCPELNLDQISAEVIEIEGNKTKFSLAVETSVGSDKFFRTRIVTISSHYIFVNTTKHKLFFRQAGSKLSFPLLPNTPTPFHWSIGKKEIVLTKDGPYQWSGPFIIDQNQVFPLKIKYNKEEKEDVVEVKVQSVVSTIYVVVASSLSIPPYLIENHSDHMIYFHQTMGGGLHQLPPHQKIPFTWDIPAGTQTVLIRDPTTLREKNHFYEIDINKDGYAIPMVINGHKLLASVATNGASSILKIAPISREIQTCEKDETVTMEIYENQRRLMLGPFSAANLLKTDRSSWTDRDGHVVDKETLKLPDKSWRWSTGWIIDFQDPNVDEEGWEYAFNWHGPWTRMPSNFGSWVRRRRWAKNRVKKHLEEVEQSSTFKITFNEIGISLVGANQQVTVDFSKQIY